MLVKVTEIKEAEIEVEAKNFTDAERLAREAMNNGEIKTVPVAYIADLV